VEQVLQVLVLDNINAQNFNSITLATAAFYAAFFGLGFCSRDGLTAGLMLALIVLACIALATQKNVCAVNWGRIAHMYSTYTPSFYTNCVSWATEQEGRPLRHQLLGCTATQQAHTTYRLLITMDKA